MIKKVIEKKRYNFYLPSSLHKKLKLDAIKIDASLSLFLESIIKHFYSSRGK